MNHFQKFQEAINIDQEKDNTFMVEPNTNYFVGNTPHGGYLMAIMHKALTNVLPHSTAISSSVQYLDRIEAKPIRLEVDIFKISKGSSSGIVKIIQDEMSSVKDSDLHSFSIPLLVDINVGDNWGDLH